MRDTNFFTPAQARETFPCPFARTFDTKVGPNCDADRCIMWRWKPAKADDPEFTGAIKREIALVGAEREEKTGKKTSPDLLHKTAVERVMRNPEGYGIKRTEGFCGLAGMPS